MTEFDNRRSDFRRWHVNIVDGLYGNRDAGLAIFTLALPYLERYLKQKTSIGEGEVNDAFKDALLATFPTLADRATAGQVWAACRNGFLHQATLLLKTKWHQTLPKCVLTHDINVPIEQRGDGVIRIHPELFSKVVIAAIENDFSTFAGTAGRAAPLPVEQRLDPVTIPSVYVGTGTPP
jgi:hypothetical protein